MRQNRLVKVTSVNPKHFPLESELNLHEPSGNTLTLQAAEITLQQQGEQVTGCRLTFRFRWDEYQYLESHRLFNFDPEIGEVVLVRDLIPGRDVEINTLLRPDLLCELEDDATDTAAIATYLQKLSQEQPTHPLLSTESWLVLSVKQQHPQGETVYRTVWDYIDW